MSETIHVNFGRPLPLFPLRDVVLLPHARQALRIHEQRYLDMIDDCLNDAKQIAIANFDVTPDDAATDPDLKPYVCVGQIIQHHRHSENLHDIVLLGLCRAKIIEQYESDDACLYMTARLHPVEMDMEMPELADVRRRIRTLMRKKSIRRMNTVNKIAGLLDRSDVPTHALLELIGFEMPANVTIKYELLAEADPLRRADIITRELNTLDRLIRRADQQPFRDWPKGVSWN